MSVSNQPIPFNFLQIQPPVTYGECDVPKVPLPMLETTDLSFMLVLNVNNPLYQYFQNTYNAGSLNPCQIGTTGLGTIGARVCVNCDDNPEDIIDMQWVMTACAQIDNSDNFCCYFQPTGTNAGWDALEAGECFNICFHEITLIQTGGASPCTSGPYNQFNGCYPYGTLGLINDTPIFCSYTTFYKITDECEGYPSSLVQFANISDAFGYYYDFLGQLTAPGINFLNSIRLPLYLHSPEDAEDQMSYQLSDGSDLKLMHRVWTDYKFKTDYLPADILKALTVATAHDLVYITCHTEGLDPWWQGFEYETYQTGDVTQFVRKEKIEIEWQQETVPRFKLGMAKGTIRLALPASNVNSNCD